MIENLIVSLVLLGFVQDSIESQPVPVSVSGEDQATDRTFRQRHAICQFLCTYRRNKHFEKETSSNLCSRECDRRKRAESLSFLELITKSKQPRSRSRRDTNSAEEKACLNPNRNDGYGARVPSEIDVDYVQRKPNLSVTWSRTFHETYHNWTSYALIYQNMKTFTSCVLVPKNRRQWIIRNGDGWNYPDSVFLGVATYPYKELPMKRYGPPPGDPPTPPPEKEGPTNKVIVAIVGVVAGLVLLLVLILVYRKRISLCPNCSPVSNGRDVSENSRCNNSFRIEEREENDNVSRCPMINNDLKLPGSEFFYACYYPENERFQFNVASVVNHFRQNGYRVVMDVMNCNELVNLGPTRWAEQQIKKASKILVFLSPGLLRLGGTGDEDSQCSNQENERVWYELSLLRTIYSQTHSAARMVCIVLPQKASIDPHDLPLWAELRYRWPEDKRKILNRLNDRPFILPL